MKINVGELLVDKELENLLPPQTDEEFLALRDDIKRQGVIQPVTIWKKFIVDGHHRIKACKELGIDEVEVTALDGDIDKAQVIVWMLANQLCRRSLTVSQRIEIANKYREEIAREARANQGAYYGNRYRKVDFGSREPKSKKKNIGK